MKKLGIIIGMLAIAIFSHAQSSFNFSLGPGIPLNEYKTTLGDNGFGGQIGLNFALQGTPLSAGFQFGYLNTGMLTDQHDFTVDIKAGNLLIDQIYMLFESQISNNTVLGHVNLRLTSPTRIVKIYGEGLIGFRYLYTSTRISDITPDDQRNENYNYNTEQFLTSKKQLEDYALSYGAGGGLMFQLGRNIWLDLGARYLLGSESEYYTKDDIQDWDIEISVESEPEPGEPQDFTGAEFSGVAKSSVIDMLFINIGISFTW